jgi:uncharacterized protein YkwD
VSRKRHFDPSEDSVSARDGLRSGVSGVADFFLLSLVAACDWSELHLPVIRTEHFMHKVLRLLLVAFLGLALLAGTAGVASAAVPSTYTQQVIDLTNQERAKVGCAPLARHAGLVDFAQKWANTMASQRKLYHSSGPTSFGFRTWGENIAYGQSTPQAVVTAWMNSAGHRANILNCRFTQIGVGAQTDSGGRIYWAQDFGG